MKYLSIHVDHVVLLRGDIAFRIEPSKFCVMIIDENWHIAYYLQGGFGSEYIINDDE